MEASKPIQVVLAGAGPLGRSLCMHLADAAAAWIAVIDPEPGLAAGLAAEAVQRHPQLIAIGLQQEIADTGFGWLAEADLILGCVGEDWTRLEIAYIGAVLDIPVAMTEPSGGLCWYPGRAAACYRCRLTTGSNGAPATGAADAASRVLEWTVNPASAPEPPPPSPTCPFHGDPGPRAAEPSRLSELLADASSAIALDWPICIRAYCEDCSTSWSPRRRAAWVRRSGRCPQCDSRYIRVIETVRRIDADSPWASRRPAELGIPERHLYRIASPVEAPL